MCKVTLMSDALNNGGPGIGFIGATISAVGADGECTETRVCKQKRCKESILYAVYTQAIDCNGPAGRKLIFKNLFICSEITNPTDQFQYTQYSITLTLT